MNDTTHVLYTYWSVEAECHVYGPASQAECATLSTKLLAEHANDQMSQFTTMVLPLEPLPEP